MSLVQQIARSLQLSEAYVLGVARSANHRYKQFTIKKADQKSDRLIEQPSRALKLLQRWIVRRVFDQLPTQPSAHAYVERRSIATNAEVHRGCRYISRLDFENFFPSLTSVDIESLLRRNRISVGGSLLSDEDILLVSLLTSRFGRLTIGAPSSPTISNKLLYDLDTRLAQIAAEHSVRYTRYAKEFPCFSTLFPKCPLNKLIFNDLTIRLRPFPFPPFSVKLLCFHQHSRVTRGFSPIYSFPARRFLFRSRLVTRQGAVVSGDGQPVCWTQEPAYCLPHSAYRSMDYADPLNRSAPLPARQHLPALAFSISRIFYLSIGKLA
jgi:hypothetical protein